MVRCASCKKPVDYRECYVHYVGIGSYNLICKECQKLPFITVMENSADAEPYSGFPPNSKTLDQILAEKSVNPVLLSYIYGRGRHGT